MYIRAEHEKRRYAICLLCRVLGVSESGYYKH